MLLVVGGAGYIGSHVVKELVEDNREVVVLDNLSTGHRWAVDERAIFIEGDMADSKLLQKVFEIYNIEAVLHFAASSLVGESVINPIKYYENNVSSTLTLLKVMKENKIDKFIFSSSAAVYGIPSVDIIDENTLTNPINPYGKSKLMVEQIVEDFHYSYGLKYVTLRYFNAAGAYKTGEIGEYHNPETHLIPLVLEHLLGKKSSISIYGNDYNTKDGTCIRDYIHVTDLARAHVLALNAVLNEEVTNAIFNLGNGNGYSVKEIIDTCEIITGIKPIVKLDKRRIGDPDVLVANSKKILKELGWKATIDIEDIIKSAWNWHKSILVKRK
ncbi:UDP-galactose-4-epimerase [Ureibacillus massiliensis 4400831 = CIP 108448 = CCUG 49529]|uniref:UDP-glucose 4-epimerase n=1 Tax=Ureibacillus massiliensis 4400831 = CIP 108448 = CCUG 49529 TaxID=1211035 RepID=A0A0A3IZ26_9BACL|nr:UDP-glucose 4-epimerase GalE [Ureibacillus massiliensis]KGR90029.1 UDP-galactose-4-epimerase [Ureibacillus massiliensis 4400831 = CIP 108448 = CCUG 49529]